MSKIKVAIVDYGVGNLLSVERAVAQCGVIAERCETPAQLLDADKIILPGVGAYKNAMQKLNEKGLTEAVQAAALAGKCLLGICLGMQMLLDESEEFGTSPGLGLIPGKVRAIPATTDSGEPHKIPHIGWNHVDSMDDDFYFVHSYVAEPKDSAHILATTNYGGRTLAAMVKKANVIGCQFHPEKSGPAGLRLIEAFLTGAVE